MSRSVRPAEQISIVEKSPTIERASYAARYHQLQRVSLLFLFVFLAKVDLPKMARYREDGQGQPVCDRLLQRLAEYWLVGTSRCPGQRGSRLSQQYGRGRATTTTTTHWKNGCWMGVVGTKQTPRSRRATGGSRDGHQLVMERRHEMRQVKY